MNINLTDVEADMIMTALQSHAARLHDYAGEYRRRGDAENAKECIADACKCYDIARKFLK